MQISLKQWLLFYCTAILLILFLITNYHKGFSSFFQIHYLDIGQGDATLIITPQNQKILIDAGPPGKLDQKLKNHFSFFDKKINLFILTHTDSDHIGGLFSLLKNYSVQQIVLPQEMSNKKEFNYLIELIQQKNIPVLFPNQNTDLQINQNVYIDFLYPTLEVYNSQQTKQANTSLVFKVIYHNNSFLFSGDAPQKQEKLIVLSGQNLNSEIYQVGHHGSKTSSSQEFLQSSQPQVSIISCERDNSFGHPHREVLTKLKNLNSQLFNTADSGTLSFYSNGLQVWKK